MDIQKSNFVQSLYTTTRAAKIYDGYLSFLPELAEGEQFFPVPLVHQRMFESLDFSWIECKGLVSDNVRPLSMKTAERTLWIHMQLNGYARLELEEPLIFSSGDGYCVWSEASFPQLSLMTGKTWFLILGIAEKHLDSLMRDYPKLKDLKDAIDGGGEQCYILGHTAIQSKIYRILDGLRRFEYHHFGTSFQLANWNLRLFHQLFQELKKQQSAAEPLDTLLYQKVRRYIREHYNEEGLTVVQVASAMNVSVRKLSRSFEGRPLTVVAMILEYRLLDAKEHLLFSDGSLADIAFGLRFACAKHFARAFKKRFGIGPNEFRSQQQKKETFVQRRIR